MNYSRIGLFNIQREGQVFFFNETKIFAFLVLIKNFFLLVEEIIETDFFFCVQIFIKRLKPINRN